MAEDSRPHVVGDLRADVACQPARDHLCDGGQEVNAQQGRDQSQQPVAGGVEGQHGVAGLLGRQHAVDQEPDELLGHQAQRDGDQHEQHHNHGPAGIGVHHLQHSSEDGPAVDAPSADVALELKRQAAGGAAARVDVVLGSDVGLLAVRPGLELARGLTERVGLGVGIGQQFDVYPVDQGIEEASAHALARANLVDFAAGDDQLHGRAATGRLRQHDQPVRLG